MPGKGRYSHVNENARFEAIARRMGRKNPRIRTMYVDEGPYGKHNQGEMRKDESSIVTPRKGQKPEDKLVDKPGPQYGPGKTLKGFYQKTRMGDRTVTTYPPARMPWSKANKRIVRANVNDERRKEAIRRRVEKSNKKGRITNAE